MSDRLARAQLARAAARLGRGGLPSLVLMTDDERLPDPLAAAHALPRGSLIVMRARDRDAREKLGRALLKLARTKGFGVLIAGDPLLAARLGADGVHFPEAQANQTAHWRARFPSMMITASAHSLRAVKRANALPVDAIFLSPVFATKSHPGSITLTPLRANIIARASAKPVYALGGIDERNVALLARDAFSGIAAIGALAI